MYRVEVASRSHTTSGGDVEVMGGYGAADALWLETLQRICGRAAHELKGALNGASVNLEVVRSRATRAEALASSISGTLPMRHRINSTP